MLKVWLQSYSAVVSGGRACGLWSILWTASSLGSRSCLWRADRQGSSEPSWPLLVLKVGRGGVWFVSSSDALWTDLLMKAFSLLCWLFCLFRCEGTLLWSYPHHDPHLPRQWSTVPGLWGQPQAHDEAVWLTKYALYNGELEVKYYSHNIIKIPIEAWKCEILPLKNFHTPSLTPLTQYLHSWNPTINLFFRSKYCLSF